MNPASLFAVFVGILFVAEVANADIARGSTDTSDGFCTIEQYGRRIRVGDTLDLSDPCERVICEDDGYEIHGCGVVVPPPTCTLRQGNGIYPHCCPEIQCEN